MTSKRVFFLMLGVLGLSFVLLIGGVVAGDLLLKKQSQKLLSLKVDNAVLDEQQKSVVQAKKDIQKYADLDKIAKSIVPQDKDQAKTVREMVALAAANNINIGSVSFPTSSLGIATAPVTTGTTTPTTPVAPSISQVTPVTGITGVYQMLVTLQVDSNSPVTYTSLINFLKALENDRRTAQFSSVQITPTSKDPSVLAFSIGINVFIKP